MTQDAGWGGGGPYGGAPYGGVLGGPPGPPPGWGGWTPPPRPGVIPLAPLRIGDVLGGAFATMGRYWKQLFGMSAALYGGAVLVMAAAVAIAYSAVSDELERMVSLSADERPVSADIVTLVTAGGSLVLLGIVVMVIVSSLMYAVVPAILQDAVLGRAITFGTVWRRACARLPTMIGTVIVTSLIVMIPFVLGVIVFVGVVISAFSLDSESVGIAVMSFSALGLLATAPLSIWLWIKFGLAPTAVVFESQGVFASLGRSSQLVRGDWWRIFGITLLAYAMASVAGYFIQMPFTILGMFPGMIGTASLDSDPTAAAVIAAISGYVVAMMLGQFISQIVATPFPQLVIGLLYVDRRIRTENLGPVLAEAALIPQQGGDPYPSAPNPGPYPTGPYPPDQYPPDQYPPGQYPPG